VWLSATASEVTRASPVAQVSAGLLLSSPRPFWPVVVLYFTIIVGILLKKFKTDVKEKSITLERIF
jgi:predicted ABC-type sugar transport system permease subunit